MTRLSQWNFKDRPAPAPDSTPDSVQEEAFDRRKAILIWAVRMTAITAVLLLF
jgi:hypothetical protein